MPTISGGTSSLTDVSTSNSSMVYTDSNAGNGFGAGGFGGGPGGFGGPNGNFGGRQAFDGNFPEGMTPPDGMTPPEGFDGKFPEGMQPPEGFNGRGNGQRPQGGKPTR